MMGIYVFSLLQDDYMSPYIYNYIHMWRAIRIILKNFFACFNRCRGSDFPGVPGAQTHDDDAGRQTNPPTAWCDVPSGNDQQFAIENSNL